MQDLTKLKELASVIEGTRGDNARALVERMGEIIEGIGDKPMEWRPGTIKLVQGTSDRSKLPKGANIGSIVLGEEILPQPYEVIPIRTWMSRQYWDPNPDNAKMLCNSPDNLVGYQYGECKSCPYSKFDSESNKSQCNKNISVLSISRDLSQVFLTNFAKTGYMNGMDWKGLMVKAGVAPYKRVYALSSGTSTKSKNVELLKAEAIANNRVDGPELAFIEELFRISDLDRKQMIVNFYEYVKNRAKNVDHALEAPADVVFLSDDSNVTDVEEKVPTEAKPETSGKVKYKV